MNNFLVMFFILIMSACGATETGNPKQPPQRTPAEDDKPLSEEDTNTSRQGSPNNDSNLPSEVQSAKEDKQSFILIRTTICAKLEECYTGIDDCNENFGSAANIDEEVGLDPNIYHTYQEMEAAEAQSELSINTDAAVECLADIANLTCAQLDDTQAFDTNHPQDYDRIDQTFPTSCQEITTQP